MKNALPVILIALLVLSSCKKDYTCVCVTTLGSLVSSSKATIKEQQKKAKKKCEAKSSNVTGSKVECHLQ